MVDDPIDYACCTQDQRETVLDRLAERMSAIHAEMLRVIVASGRLEDFKVDGAFTMADWLAYRYNLSPRIARQWVKVATALEEMPLVREAFASGRVGFEQLVHALSFATPADDGMLAELLPSLSCAETETLAQQRRKVTRLEHAGARGSTYLRLRPDESGLGSRISGFLPTEDAAYVQAGLVRRADAVGPDPETGVWAKADERMAGALRDVCAEDLARAAADGSDPDASVVVVHVPLAAMSDDADDEAPNATIDGQPIDADTLQRMLCDTKIEFSIDEPDGRTVGIGRASRTPPRWLRRRVVGRDQGCCRWPGCTRPIRHLHHMKHWPHGGPTNASNLMGVCWHHHHMLHEGGWTATGSADRQITLTNKWGRTIDSRAGPIAA